MKKFNVSSKNCALCHSLIMNGLRYKLINLFIYICRCNVCNLNFHKKCYCKRPTLCDPNIFIFKNSLNDSKVHTNNDSFDYTNDTKLQSICYSNPTAILRFIFYNFIYLYLVITIM